MAINRYFTNFPTINYNSANAVNITERVVFLNNAIKNPYLFYPYDIADNERPDQFANRYYGDSYKSWLLYLGNQIIDPYYGWYMSTDDFNNYLNLTYASSNAKCTTLGSQLALTKIKYYENNWYAADPIIPSAFNALPTSLYKYWQPVYDSFNNIISYTRTQIVQNVTTNSIRSYTVSNTNFIHDEIVQIVYNSNNIGQGQILSVNSNTSTIYVQHVSGVTLPNTSVVIASNSYIFGNESSVNTVFTAANDVIDNIPAIEASYWNPVTYYAYESAKNEYNKSIIVLDSAYAPSVVSSVKTLLE